MNRRERRVREAMTPGRYLATDLPKSPPRSVKWCERLWKAIGGGTRRCGRPGRREGQVTRRMAYEPQQAWPDLVCFMCLIGECQHSEAGGGLTGPPHDPDREGWPVLRSARTMREGTALCVDCALREDTPGGLGKG